MSLNFASKVAIITGAGGALGSSYAKFLAAHGAKVVINNRISNYLTEQKADKLVQEIQAEGGEAIADYNDVMVGEKIVETALENFGRVDILINNAGVFKHRSFQNLQSTDWRNVVDTNLTSHFAVTRAVWEIMMRQNYGRIINTAAPSALYGVVGSAN